MNYGVDMRGAVGAVMRTLALSLSVTVPTSVGAQNEETPGMTIQQVDIDSRSDTALTGNLSTRMYIPLAALENAPKVLGFSDPLKYLQALPGVQTTNEMQGGLFVDGTGSSHTQVQIDAAPIYNPSHLLGLYSMFNNLHFRTMEFSRRAGTAGNRLGAQVVMRSDTVRPKKVSAKLAAGLIGSQANVRMPVFENSVLSVSARATYLNFLYGDLLDRFMDGNSLVYGFKDVNANWTSRFGQKDVLNVSFFDGMDKANILIPGDDSNIRSNWENMAASATWEHATENGHIDQSVYRTSYFCTLNTYSFDNAYTLPGGLTDMSYELDGVRFFGGNILKYGAKVSRYGFRESVPEISNAGQADRGHNVNLSSWSYTAHADFEWCLNMNNMVEASLLGSRFTGNADGDVFNNLDPSVSFTHTFNDRAGSMLKIEAGTSHQYLHLFGYTSNGLPTEFWLPADAGIRPEWSRYCSLNFEGGLFDNAIGISAELYCKSLNNLVEFNNGILDVFFENYSMRDGLVTGNGYSYGMNLMIRKDRGRLNGWISYAYGRAFTKVSGADAFTPTYFERPHDLNVRINWKAFGKWTFGADGLFCSGTPFTMPKYIYFLNEGYVIEYGSHNNARMPANWRLDLSADWNIRHDEKCSYGLNFSLYNALCNENVMYYYFGRIYHKEAPTYAMKYFVVTPICIPSISFHIEL